MQYSMQPINYLDQMGGLPDPMKAINEAIGDQIQLRDRQLQHEVRQAELNKLRREVGEEDAYKRDMLWTLDNDATAAGFSRLMGRYGRFREPIKAAWEMKDKAVRDSELKIFSEIYAAGQNDRMDLAIATAERKLEADKKAGLADDEDQAFVDMLRSDDPIQQKRALGMVLSHIGMLTGPEKMTDFYRSVAKDRRDEELHTPQLAKARADAETAEAEAEFADDFYGSRARKGAADAKSAEAESAWAAVKARAGADLTQAQVANIRSLIANRGRETGSNPAKLTIAQVMAPIYAKMAAGTQLTPGEQSAMAAYRRPGGKQPAGAASSSAPPPAASPPPRQAPTIVNPKTGQRMTLQNGRWVEVR